MARRGFFRIFRGGSKLLGIWSFLSLLVAAAWVKQNILPDISWSALSSDLNLLAEVLLPVTILAFTFIAVGYLFYRLFLSKSKKRIKLIPSSNLGSFALEPSSRDRKSVRIYGQVTHVLVDGVGKHLKRKVIDLYRTVTHNENQKGRNVYQRFVIESSHLQAGESLLVVHSAKNGKKDVRVGSWIDVQGQYVHQPLKKKTKSGELVESAYGLIHCTHKPKGHLRAYPSEKTLLGDAAERKRWKEVEQKAKQLQTMKQKAEMEPLEEPTDQVQGSETLVRDLEETANDSDDVSNQQIESQPSLSNSRRR